MAKATKYGNPKSARRKQRKKKGGITAAGRKSSPTVDIPWKSYSRCLSMRWYHCCHAESAGPLQGE